MNDSEKSFLKAFGASVASARMAKSLTQKQLAYRVNIAPAYLASIETGRRWPHLSIIHGIADELDTTLHKIIFDAGTRGQHG